jgi:hypothetical protein
VGDEVVSVQEVTGALAALAMRLRCRMLNTFARNTETSYLSQKSAALK